MIEVKKGDSVTVTLEGRTIQATVAIASVNGASLALSFDAFFGGYVNLMPVLYVEAPHKQHYVDLVEGREVTITLNT